MSPELCPLQAEPGLAAGGPPPRADHDGTPQNGLALIEHFRAMDSVFGRRCPGDLEAACDAHVRHRPMFVAEPALELWSIQCKYGPCKEVLWQEWQRQAALHPELWDRPSDATTWEERAARAGEVIAGSVPLIAYESLQSWTLHCGKSVCHHSGYLALLQRMGFIKKGMRPLLGEACEVPALVVQRLVRYVQAADVLRDSLSVPLLTCQMWVSQVGTMVAALQKIKSLSMAGKHTYLTLWTFRTGAWARMQNTPPPPSGWLTGSEDVSVSTWARCMPDVHDWMSQCAHTQGNYVWLIVLVSVCKDLGIVVIGV